MAPSPPGDEVTLLARSIDHLRKVVKPHVAQIELAGCEGEPFAEQSVLAEVTVCSQGSPDGVERLAFPLLESADTPEMVKSYLVLILGLSLQDEAKRDALKRYWNDTSPSLSVAALAAFFLRPDAVGTREDASRAWETLARSGAFGDQPGFQAWKYGDGPEVDQAIRGKYLRPPTDAEVAEVIGYCKGLADPDVHFTAFAVAKVLPEGDPRVVDFCEWCWYSPSRPLHVLALETLCARPNAYGLSTLDRIRGGTPHGRPNELERIDRILKTYKR